MVRAGPLHGQGRGFESLIVHHSARVPVHCEIRREDMTLEELEKLIAEDEGETVEVKETTGQRRDACETLCAFLNKDGGTVAVWYDFLSAA